MIIKNIETPSGEKKQGFCPFLREMPMSFSIDRGVFRERPRSFGGITVVLWLRKHSRKPYIFRIYAEYLIEYTAYLYRNFSRWSKMFKNTVAKNMLNDIKKGIRLTKCQALSPDYFVKIFLFTYQKRSISRYSLKKCILYFILKTLILWYSRMKKRALLRRCLAAWYVSTDSEIYLRVVMILQLLLLLKSFSPKETILLARKLFFYCWWSWAVSGQKLCIPWLHYTWVLYRFFVRHGCMHSCHPLEIPVATFCSN